MLFPVRQQPASTNWCFGSISLADDSREWLSPVSIINQLRLPFQYIPRPRPDKESRGRERGIPRTMGTLYRWASPSEREGLYWNGIPVWFCLAWNLLGLDSSLLTSISPGTLFQARNNCVRKRKKPSSLKQENGLESGADSQRPFSKQKSRDS